MKFQDEINVNIFITQIHFKKIHTFFQLRGCRQGPPESGAIAVQRVGRSPKKFGRSHCRGDSMGPFTKPSFSDLEVSILLNLPKDLQFCLNSLRFPKPDKFSSLYIVIIRLQVDFVSDKQKIKKKEKVIESYGST